ncbi:MAG: hypothetical protein KDD60_00235 [Bdellovibrionales bacterium]|nr:hypothetical protein [Bdellovibrionales bacterium]
MPIKKERMAFSQSILKSLFPGVVLIVGLLSCVGCSSAEAPGRQSPSVQQSSGETDLPEVQNGLIDIADVRTFQDCVSAGFPIMRSFPPKCATPDGRVFVDSNGFDGVKNNSPDANPLPLHERDGADPKIGDTSETTCKNLCGDGRCQQMVCMALGCPCAETPESCPEDCSLQLGK